MVDGEENVVGGDSQLPVNTAAATTEMEMAIPRLSLIPNDEHMSDNYDDLKHVEFSSIVLRSLEKYLPPEMLTANREEKAKFMSDILGKYISREDCSKDKWRTKYNRKIMSSFQPRLRELYKLDPKSFLVPSFRKAVTKNTEESFKRVISEPFPGVFVFQMFQPEFCEKLLVEVENFRKWARDTKLKIRRPSNASKCGVALHDLGLENMLKNLMEDFVFPICKVFFPEVCGALFDSHDGFVVEYGEDKDTELGFHVEDSDITLNVCLSNQCEGGDLYFAGIRCEKHMDSNNSKGIFDYCHIPGQAILHRGFHGHGANPITSGYRSNMILWCKNSLYREMKTYQKDFSDWCDQCAHEKKENEIQSLATKRKEMIRTESEANETQQIAYTIGNQSVKP